MGWVVTGLSSIQNSQQGTSNCQVSPVSVQPVSLLLPAVLLFFLCIMLWYIEAISKQMHILSTYLEVFRLSEWESHYQDLLKSTKLCRQESHVGRRLRRSPFKTHAYSIQSDMPNIILGVLILLTIIITAGISLLYWSNGISKSFWALSFFIITAVTSVVIFSILWLHRDLDGFRGKVKRSWVKIYRRTLNGTVLLQE